MFRCLERDCICLHGVLWKPNCWTYETLNVTQHWLLQPAVEVHVF